MGLLNENIRGKKLYKEGSEGQEARLEKLEK
jgi:hypothetical protein